MATKTLSLTIVATRFNETTQQDESQTRTIAIPEQFFINKLLEVYPVLQSVDSVEITAGAWVVDTIVEE